MCGPLPCGRPNRVPKARMSLTILPFCRPVKMTQGEQIVWFSWSPFIDADDPMVKRFIFVECWVVTMITRRLLKGAL